jgi:hypothetical protein
VVFTFVFFFFFSFFFSILLSPSLLMTPYTFLYIHFVTSPYFLTFPPILCFLLWCGVFDSHRPSVPGQVCYGTNNKGVALPRRPMTASGGRENRPSTSELFNKSTKELDRNDYGGWEPSTQLGEDRTNFDGRYRYPQKYAEGDIARVAEYRVNPPPYNGVSSKPAWVHTTSSSNFAKGNAPHH